MSYTKANKTGKSTPNDVVMTKEETAKQIINYFSSQFNDSDLFCDPCYGDRAFLNNYPENNCKFGYEITDGDDFLLSKNLIQFDWIITNPPFSIFDDFLLKSFECSNNVVFFIPLNKVFKSKKIDQAIKNYGGIKEIIHMGTGGQHGFPFGFPVGCVHYKKGYNGDIKYTRFYKE